MAPLAMLLVSSFPCRLACLGPPKTRSRHNLWKGDDARQPMGDGWRKLLLVECKHLERVHQPAAQRLTYQHPADFEACPYLKSMRFF